MLATETENSGTGQAVEKRSLNLTDAHPLPPPTQRSHLIGEDRTESPGLPGPAEEALPEQPQCGEFSEAMRAVL